MFRLSRVGIGLLAAAVTLSAFPTHAEDNWWFDVEVIVFDRNTALNQLQETFELADNVSPYNADIDVIGSIIRPDISWIKQNLALCDGSDAPLWRPAPSLNEITQTYTKWQQQQRSEAGLPAADDVSDSVNTQLSETRPADSVIPNNDDTTIDSVVPTYTFQLSDAEIASYWVEFSGINNFTEVSVPRFRYCEETAPWMTYTDTGWKRHTPDNRLPAPAEIPIELSGHDWPRASQAHLLSANARELEKLSEQIRRNRELTRLLHITWRQEVTFGQDNAPTVRLYAGKNYADDFTLDGYAVTPEPEFTNPASELPQEDTVRTLTEDTFFADLNARLDSPQTVPLSRLLQLQASKNNASALDNEQHHADSDTPIWQVDGYMKVFLKYINRVPYLHIDSEMFYRQPVPVTSQETSAEAAQPEYKLVSVPFKQLRRVISKQLHYFDHPLFGVVVEIRRYERPELQEEPAQ